jgi:AAHS family benzoate transporter-like MFS transporter
VPSWSRPSRSTAVSYALVGVLVGALLAGTMSDVLGRRKLMLLSYAWFSVGICITALMSTTTGFGLMRFVTGLGVGSLVATTGAIVSEFAPPGKKNLVQRHRLLRRALREPAVRAARRHAARRDRLAGHVLDGALPIVTLLPLAFFKMPESPTWLLSRGRVDEARAVSERTGVPLDEAPPVAAPARGDGASGWASPAVQRGERAPGDPARADERDRPRPGLRAQYVAARVDEARRVLDPGSVAFLLVLNGGAVVGALIGSRIADRLGPKPVVAGSFLIGAISIALLTLGLPIGLLLLFVAIVGLGTSGTQTLIYGFVANYFRTNVRGAAVAWCAAFGRLGGVGGPLLGGLLAPPAWRWTRSSTCWPGWPCSA